MSTQTIQQSPTTTNNLRCSGRELRLLRKANGKTLDWVSLRTGINRALLSLHETGTKPLTAANQQIVERVLRSELARHAVMVERLLESGGGLAAD
jgi:hypothetical protein